MSTEFLSRIPWLALGILWLAYILLGWYLAAHHILWLVGAVLIATVIMVTGTGRAILKQLSWLGFQGLLITVATSFIATLCLILFVSDFQFLELVFLPVVTIFWADLELRSAEFEPRQILMWLVAIASFGVAFGELLDLSLIPSMRF